MGKVENYRRNAAEAIELASRASCYADKGRLLAMAEAWLDLADRVHRSSPPGVQLLKEHILVRAMLGPNELDAE